MSHAKKAVDEIQNLVKRFQPLFELSKALEQVGDYEQLAREAQEKKKVAEESCEHAQKVLDGIKNEAQKADEYCEEKGKEAVRIVEAANAKAALTIKAAETECKNMYAQFDKVKSELNKQIQDANSELVKSLKEVEDSKKILKSLKDEFEYYKTKVASFLK